MKRLSRAQVVALQEQQIDLYGGIHGIRDEALLDAALHAPFAAFGGTELFSTIEEKAARIAYGLVANHPFNDGNKRVGVIAMLVLADLNNHPIEATDDELIELGLSLADGSIQQDETVAWINAHS